MANTPLMENAITVVYPTHDKGMDHGLGGIFCKGGNVTSAGWQVTLCDPIWHVSSRSGDGRLACKLIYPSLLFLLLSSPVNQQSTFNWATTSSQLGEQQVNNEDGSELYFLY